MGTKTDKAIRSLKVTQEIYPLVKKFYQDSRLAKEQNKVVCWAGVGDPRELFWAMDLVPVYPENFSAACGAKQISAPACEIAEDAGYSRDTCSYFRNTYGYMVNRENLPEPPGGGMPLPDILILAVNSCHTRPKWWRIMEKYYNIPTFILEAPTIPWDMRRDSIDPHYIDFVVSQIKDMVAFIEKHTGSKLDMNKLREAVYWGDRASALIDEIYELRKAVPCPLGAEDMVTALFPIIVLRGIKEAAGFYENMLAEVRERVASGEGVLPGERHRLFVDNIPPWYTKGLYNYFHKFNGISVAESYTTTFCWQARMDPERPFESLAYSTIANWVNISYEEKGETLLRVARDYRIDGAIFLVNKSCKVYTGSNTFLANLLRREMGIPSLVLEADQTDPRDYADAQVKTRVDAFMEMLG
jgi:benzoyl-CoA reductase/2-hydroxyglutaryl-CoA dehydratase subunit BcrC/BadD/HgdB